MVLEGFQTMEEHDEYNDLTYLESKFKQMEVMNFSFGSWAGEKEIANVTVCMKSQWMGFGGNV